MARKIDSLYFELRAQVDALSGDLDLAERRLQQTADLIQAHPVAAAAVLTAGLLEIGKKAIDAAEEVDTSMRTIAASLNVPVENLKQLGDQLDDIAQKAGRANSEIEAAAVQAAHARPGSTPEDIGNITQAATTFADATGTQLSSSIELLSNVMRIFGLDSGQALDVMAHIKDAADTGHVSVEELASGFIHAGPTFDKFGIDVDTALRAVTTLVSKYGETGRQVGATIKTLDAEGIREYAKQTNLAADANDRMASSAATVEGETVRAAQRVDNEFTKAWRGLGNELKPLVTDTMSELAALLDHIGNSKLPSWLTTQDPLTNLAASLGGTVGRFLGLPQVGSDGPKVLGAPTFTTIPPIPPAPPAPKPYILNAEDKKQIEGLNSQLVTLLATEESGKSKSDQFAESMAKWLDQAAASKMGADEYSKALAALNGHLAELRQQEAVDALAKQAKAWADQSKATSDAFGSLSDQLAKFTGGALTDFDAETGRVLKGLDEMRAKLKPEDLPEFDRGVAALRDKFVGLRVAVAETVDSEQELGAARDLIQSQTATTQQLSDEIGRLTGLWDNAEKKSKAATDPKVAEQYKNEAKEILAVIQQLFGAWDQVGASVQKAGDNVGQLAEKLGAVATAAIAAATQLGLMDSRTAQGLEGGVNTGVGVARIASGDVLGGSLQVLGGITELGKSLFGLGKNSAEARQRAIELQDSLANLFRGLQTEISATGGNSLAERIAAAQQEYENARNTIETDEGGKKNQTQREQDLDKLNALEAKRTAEIEAQYEEEQKESQEDYHVRQLRAQGLAAQADAEAFAEQQAREYAQAVKDGADDATLAALKQTQLAEAEQFAAEQAQKAAEAQIDAGNKQASLNAKVFGETPDQQFIDKAQVYSALPGFKQLFDGLNLTTEAGLAEFKKRLQAFLKGIDDGSIVLDTSVYSIDDFNNAIGDLSDSADAAAASFESAAQKIADADSLIDTKADILGTPAGTVIQQHAYNEGFNLDNFDLTTDAGRQSAIDYLTGVFNSLDPNGDGYADKVKTIDNLIKSIRALPATSTAAGANTAGASAGAAGASSSTATGANAAAVATQSSVDRMGDYLATLVEVNREELALWTKYLTGLTTPIITGPLLPPRLPSFFGSGSGSAAGAALTTTVVQHQDILNVSLTLNIDGSTFLMDRTDALKLSREMGEQINQYLAAKLRAAQRLRGDTTLPSGPGGVP